MAEIEDAIKKLDVDKVRDLLSEPSGSRTRGQKRARMSLIDSRDKDGFSLVGQAMKHLMPVGFQDENGYHIDKEAHACPGTCCRKYDAVYVGHWERSTEPRDVVLRKVLNIVRIVFDQGYNVSQLDVSHPDFSSQWAKSAWHMVSFCPDGEFIVEALLVPGVSSAALIKPFVIRGHKNALLRLFHNMFTLSEKHIFVRQMIRSAFHVACCHRQADIIESLWETFGDNARDFLWLSVCSTQRELNVHVLNGMLDVIKFPVHHQSAWLWFYAAKPQFQPILRDRVFNANADSDDLVHAYVHSEVRSSLVVHGGSLPYDFFMMLIVDKQDDAQTHALLTGLLDRIDTLEHISGAEQKISLAEVATAKSKPGMANLFKKFVLDKLDKCSSTIRSINSTTLIRDHHDRDCCICAESFASRDKITIFPCNHFFHYDCIKTAIDLAGDGVYPCPYCRQPFGSKECSSRAIPEFNDVIEDLMAWWRNHDESGQQTK